MEQVKKYYEKLKNTVDLLNFAEIENGIQLIDQARRNHKQVITFGNGGSASTASHFICDWNKGASYQKEIRIRGLCLNDNFATVMAYANDVSYASVFVEQLKNFLQPGDLVIGISGSGNSENVLQAIQYANEKDAITLGLCGYDGGKLKQLARHSIWVNVNDMQIVEDLHLSFGHVAMQQLCGRMTC